MESQALASLAASLTCQGSTKDAHSQISSGRGSCWGLSGPCEKLTTKRAGFPNSQHRFVLTRSGLRGIANVHEDMPHRQLWNRRRVHPLQLGKIDSRSLKIMTNDIASQVTATAYISICLVAQHKYRWDRHIWEIDMDNLKRQ
jgi:hypothetical protein